MGILKKKEQKKDIFSEGTGKEKKYHLVVYRKKEYLTSHPIGGEMERFLIKNGCAHETGIYNMMGTYGRDLLKKLDKTLNNSDEKELSYSDEIWIKCELKPRFEIVEGALNQEDPYIKIELR